MTVIVLEPHASKASKIFGWVLLLLGTSIPAAVRWLEPDATVSVPRWACWCIPIIVVLSWISSRSWLRTSGPMIDMSDLWYDPTRSFYLVTVTNCGRSPVSPRLKLLSVTYLGGEKTGVFRDSLEIAETLHPKLSMRGEHIDAVILAWGPRLGSQTLSVLSAWAAVAPGTEPPPIVPPSTSVNRKPIRIRIAADCGESGGGNQITKTFVLRPREGTDEYTVETKKRWLN